MTEEEWSPEENFLSASSYRLHMKNLHP